METVGTSFPAAIIFFKYSTEYFSLIFSAFVVWIVVVSSVGISMCALDISPSAETVNFSLSPIKETLSPTISTSSIASTSCSAFVVIVNGKFKSGIFCSRSSASIMGRENVLFVLLFSVTSSLLSTTSNVIISFGFARLSTCLRLLRFKERRTSFSTSYSTKLVARSLKMTIATFAGSIATSSIPVFVILKRASVTNSLMIEILSLRYFGSANVNFMVVPLMHYSQYY